MSRSRILSVVLLAVALTGCARNIGATPRIATNVRAAGANAASVAPDDAKVLAEDTRRARYWADDAVRVMAVHTTGLNTTALSAAANVFYSDTRFHNAEKGKPALFVARHYGFASVAQYTELKDYEGLVAGISPLGESPTPVTAAAAFSLAKTAPASTLEGCPAGSTCPPPAANKRIFMASRAILIGSEWRLYADNQVFVVNAETKEVKPPVAAPNPQDPLNTGRDIDLVRASMVFLPTNPMQANIQVDPVSLK